MGIERDNLFNLRHTGELILGIDDSHRDVDVKGVFISYAREDLASALRLYEDLKPRVDLFVVGQKRLDFPRSSRAIPLLANAVALAAAATAL